MIPYTITYEMNLGVLLVFSVSEPFVVYHALLRDSKWWQGLNIGQGMIAQYDKKAEVIK